MEPSSTIQVDQPGSPAPCASGEAALLEEDAACLGCGYNLRGLTIGGVCPECAEPVVRSLALEPSLVTVISGLNRLAWSARLLILALFAFLILGAIALPVALCAFVPLLVSIVVSVSGWWRVTGMEQARVPFDQRSGVLVRVFLII